MGDSSEQCFEAINNRQLLVAFSVSSNRLQMKPMERKDPELNFVFSWNVIGTGLLRKTWTGFLHLLELTQRAAEWNLCILEWIERCAMCNICSVYIVQQTWTQVEERGWLGCWVAYYLCFNCFRKQMDRFLILQLYKPNVREPLPTSRFYWLLVNGISFHFIASNATAPGPKSMTKGKSILPCSSNANLELIQMCTVHSTDRNQNQETDELQYLSKGLIQDWWTIPAFL